MNVLLSGFEPFEKESVNPSFEAVKRLETSIAGAAILTVEYRRCSAKPSKASTQSSNRSDRMW